MPHLFSIQFPVRCFLKNTAFLYFYTDEWEYPF